MIYYLLDDDPFDEPAAAAGVRRDAAVLRDDPREDDDRLAPAPRLESDDRLAPEDPPDRAALFAVEPAPRLDRVPRAAVAAFREAPPLLLVFFAAVFRPVCFRALLDVATRSPFPGLIKRYPRLRANNRRSLTSAPSRGFSRRRAGSSPQTTSLGAPMKAVTFHGKRDVRVDTVPDPRIEHPTDAIIQITSTGICGSDLHRYEVMGAFMDEGDILRHEPMGIVQESVPTWCTSNRATASSCPSTSPVGIATCVISSSSPSVRPPRCVNQNKGAALLGYTKLYGQVPGGQAEPLRVPQAHFGPIKVPDGPPDERYVYLSDVLPTAWQAVEYAAIPDGGSVAVYGLGPIGQMSARIALHQGAGRAFGVDLVPERLEMAARHGIEPIDVRDGDPAEALRERTDGRGPDSIIDAVGMEAHGSPIGKLAHQIAGMLPDSLTRLMMDKAGSTASASCTTPFTPSAAGHDLAQRGVRRLGRSHANDGSVRQADPASDGPGQREALGAGHHAPAGGRHRSTRRGGPRDPQAATRPGAPRLRDLPAQAGRGDQDPPAAIGGGKR